MQELTTPNPLLLHISHQLRLSGVKILCFDGLVSKLLRKMADVERISDGRESW
jgi:hypothetical protein